MFVYFCKAYFFRIHYFDVGREIETTKLYKNILSTIL